MGVEANRTVRINFIAEDQNVGTVLKGVDGKLRDVKGRFVAAGTEARLFGLAGEQAGQKTASALARARAAIQKTAKSGKDLVKSLKDVGLLGLGFSTVANAAREAVQAMEDYAREAVEVQQVSQNLQFGIGAAAEETGGFVDNMTLARNANKAFALGVAKDSREFAELAGAAQKIAAAQGVDAQKLVEQAVVGIGRKSAARLDDLGIIITQTKAERIYAKSLNKTASQLSLLEKEEAFQKAALIEIKKAGDKASASVDGFAVTVVKGRIELENTKQNMQGFDDSLGKVREALRGLDDADLERIGKFGEFAADGTEQGLVFNRLLGEWGVSLADVRIAADELGVSFKDLFEGQEEMRGISAADETLKGLNALNQARIRDIETQADAMEFQSKLAAAEGEGQTVVNFLLQESLELRRDAAELQALQTESTADETALLAAQQNLQLAEASAEKKGGGGRGATRSERALAAGEQRIAQLELEAELAGILAGDSEAAAEADRASFEARQARLELEREGLELQRARGKFAKQELANELAANTAEQQVVAAGQRVAARERVNELVSEAVSLETARSSAEANAAARRFELLGTEERMVSGAAQRAAEANAARLQASGQTLAAIDVRLNATLAASSAETAALDREFAARELLRQQAELELQANPPEKELERIQQRDALAQIAHEREMDRQAQDAAAAQKRADQDDARHEAELKRIAERTKKQKAAIDASGRFLGAGQSFASAIINASIKDEDKRAQAELKARGVMAIATGALEVVRGVAAAASLNPVQAALHAAAAVTAFTTGGIMLAGQLPGRGSAGGGGGAAAAAAAPDRETDEAARIVESLPAADREPPQQPTGQQQGGGSTFNGDINISVLGAIDDESAEKIRIGLDSVNNGLEPTG